MKQLGVAKPKGGILETLWGAIQGGFNEEPSGIAIDIGIGLIPVAGQLADARDILACMKKLGTNGKSDDVMVWVELILALIGFIPGIGDTLKGIVKAIQKAKDREAVKFIKKLAGSDDIMKGLDRASRLFERLRPKVVQKLSDMTAAPMVDQAFQIIKKIIDDFREKSKKQLPPHFETKERLKPNITYKTGEFDYFYTTDNKGRIQKAEAANLQRTPREERLQHDDNSPDKRSGDEAGHLIADQFGGSPKLDNIVSQTLKANRSGFGKLENRWRDALKNTPPEKVEVYIDIEYATGTRRPTKFNVEYFIDGIRSHTEIPNL